MYIYKLTNNKNGKIYIGQSCRNPEVRWEEHVKDSVNENVEDMKYLHRAIRKNGWENFSKEIIEIIPIEKGQKFLDLREFHHILENQSFYKFGKGYNLTLGGRGTKGHSSCKSEKIKQKSEQSDTYDYANYNPITGELVNVYTNVRDAAKGVGGKSYEWVSRAADWIIGKAKYATKTYKGYIWMKLPNGENFPKKIQVKLLDTIQSAKKINSQPRDKNVTSEKNNYEISQYNLLGNLEKIWPNNLRLIEREFQIFFPKGKITYNSILNVTKGKSFSAGGYFWKRFPLGKSPKTISVMSEYEGYELNKDELTKQPINMFDLNGRKIRTFDSIISIPEEFASSFDKLEIYKIVTGKSDSNKYKSFVWEFVNKKY